MDPCRNRLLIGHSMHASQQLYIYTPAGTDCTQTFSSRQIESQPHKTRLNSTEHMFICHAEIVTIKERIWNCFCSEKSHTNSVADRILFLSIFISMSGWSVDRKSSSLGVCFAAAPLKRPVAKMKAPPPHLCMTMCVCEIGAGTGVQMFFPCYDSDSLDGTYKWSSIGSMPSWPPPPMVTRDGPPIQLEARVVPKQMHAHHRLKSVN